MEDSRTESRRSTVRRLVPLIFALAVLAVLAGCAGGRGHHKPQAWIHIDVLASGDAQLDLFAAGRLNSDADVRALAHRVSALTFPGTTIHVRTRTSHGLPYARAEIADAYRPGRRASVRIDTAAAWRSLAAHGFTESAVRLRLPSVPATVTGTDTRLWHLREGTAPRVVQVTMRPRPARWYAAMLLPVLGASGVALAFFARRRVLAVPSALVAIGAAAATFPASAGRQGDNLGVAGHLDGTALDAATLAPLTALATALPAAMLLAAIGVRAARRPSPRDTYETTPNSSGTFW